MSQTTDLSYVDAGVDIDFAATCLLEIDKTHCRKNEVINNPNDFAGLFSIKELCQRFDDPVLVSGTDGVGTKLLAAIICEKYDGLGQDLVAMCVNDIVTKGAEPLFFLDYFATSKLRSVPFVKIVNSIVKACEEINCALIGGETAEVPALYATQHFDLAGFAVGVVDRSQLLGAHRVSEGDALLGLYSSGLHANGFSLVRKIIFDKLQHRPNDVLWQTEQGIITVADELLRPTRIYVHQIKMLLQNGINIKALAHITGGGLLENVPRILPQDLMADIDLSCLSIPPIFSYLMERGPIGQEEMLRTFNMGLGMIVSVDPRDLTRASAILKENGEMASEIGVIKKHKGDERCRVRM